MFFFMCLHVHVCLLVSCHCLDFHPGIQTVTRASTGPFVHRLYPNQVTWLRRGAWGGWNRYIVVHAVAQGKLHMHHETLSVGGTVVMRSNFCTFKPQPTDSELRYSLSVSVSCLSLSQFGYVGYKVMLLNNNRRFK